MAGRSLNSLGSKNKDWSPGSPTTRYNVSGKSREFYTFENAPGQGAYASGGTIIDGGDGYIYHIFTGDGTFQVNRPPAAIDSVEYLIVGGGGGASFPAAGGGGGGGGFRFGVTPVIDFPGSYPITIGGGGPNSAPSGPGAPRNGSPSTAFGFTATGGGGGGTGSPVITPRDGGNGGSGGGGGPNLAFGGAGNSPGTIPRQGYTGGNGAPNLPVQTPSGGGGGAGGVGFAGFQSPFTPTPTGVGGTGAPGRIAPEFPSTVVSRGIPAPVLPSWLPLVSTSGYAAGGNGRGGILPTPKSAPANSGYGGQADPVGTNSVGGSGIVCIKYKKTGGYSRATGGTIEPNTHPEHPGVWRHIFTGDGNFEITDPSLQWIDYFAVAGGGGGGNGAPPTTSAGGGGGGAGGFVSSIHASTSTPTEIPEAYPWNPGYSVRVGERMPVGVGTYPITIGGGGGANLNGSNTTIGNPGASQIIAYGGGGGNTGTGSPGGSGGGGGKPSPAITQTPVSSGSASPSPLIQGNPGGLRSPGVPAIGGSSGGGGAFLPGGAVSPGQFNGGTGYYSVISPTSYGITSNALQYFAGGGGGTHTPSPGPGGLGGGGRGGPGVGGNGTDATANTGGGGGGGAYGSPAGTGGNGGSGIVIIQYPE